MTVAGSGAGWWVVPGTGCRGGGTGYWVLGGGYCTGYWVWVLALAWWGTGLSLVGTGLSPSLAAVLALALAWLQYWP